MGTLMEVDPFELLNVFEETKWMDAYQKTNGFDSIVYNNKVEDSRMTHTGYLTRTI